ncbi:MAG: 23S rRNA (pseudouridine(1915)-N(3))-methyltransferase RlmH [SAR324 cluster bacterium]|nr:23S rRNA (pseudouridine(1915)-N(3))-methyltransferase RlmH [SAR324 cluster bacterium]
MYKVRFIWVGKTQEPYLKTGIQHYLAKLKHYVTIECLEIKPSDYAHVTQAQCISKETELILKKINPSETTIILDERGSQKTSVQLAEWLEELKTIQHSRVNFVMGGAFGLEVSRFKKPHQLSLSAMTYTHQMVRLILLEQVYRAFTITNGESYHHF